MRNIGARSNSCVVILGAGRSLKGSEPSALVRTDENHRVLDWVLESFSSLHEPNIYFIGGYKIDAIEENYPSIRFLFNTNWATSGAAASLALMPPSDSDTYICYSDIVFRPALVRAISMATADVVLAIDSKWRTRYDGRGKMELEGAEKIRFTGNQLLDIGKSIATNQANGEFAGLVKLSSGPAKTIRAALQSGIFRPNDGLPALIRHLAFGGVRF